MHLFSYIIDTGSLGAFFDFDTAVVSVFVRLLARIFLRISLGVHINPYNLLGHAICTLCTGQCTDQVVYTIYLALDSAALLGVGGKCGLYPLKFTSMYRRVS